jgi:dTDP-4-dehydrorhamnose reductase
MAGARRILIVGGESKLGRALADAHRAGGDHVETTSRHPRAGQVALDLATVADDWCVPGEFDAAYLCAAVTSLHTCETDPRGAERINVEGTLAVARALQRRGVFVVFPSTNLVFDGTRPDIPPESVPSPRCEYGRQKMAVENALRSSSTPAAIVRLTKVIEPAHPLFTGWITELKRQQPVSVFTDYRAAPLALAEVVAALVAITTAQAAGLHHLSACADLSYVDIARHFAAELGASPHLVTGFLRPASAIPSPLHTTLERSEWQKNAGWQRPRPLRSFSACLAGGRMATTSHEITSHSAS